MHFRKLHGVSRKVMENYSAFPNSQLHWLRLQSSFWKKKCDWTWSVRQILSGSIDPHVGLLFGPLPEAKQNRCLTWVDGLTANPYFYVCALGVQGARFGYRWKGWIQTASISPLCERDPTNASFRYSVSRHMKTGKLSERLCLAWDPDTWNFIFTIIITIRALSSNITWADFIGLSGIRLKKKNPQQTLFLHIKLLFLFLLIRVKFSTEKDAVLFALKVSLFHWKRAVTIYFGFNSATRKMVM